ncbi:hypothetical protein MFAL_26890 [Mycolicibacterium fallax]|nr:hypothetical protein MFAL_26890 [Mycolicibacterium fallax]
MFVADVGEQVGVAVLPDRRAEQGAQREVGPFGLLGGESISGEAAQAQEPGAAVRKCSARVSGGPLPAAMMAARSAGPRSKDQACSRGKSAGVQTLAAVAGTGDRIDRSNVG